MDIEKLTKMQIVLLTLLVSFVTSIATGIVTASLVAQTPPPVTQTINRIAERTIEKIVSAETVAATADSQAVIAATAEVAPPQLSEEERLTGVIASRSKSVVRIYRDTARQQFSGLGVYLAEGVIVTDEEVVPTRRAYAVELPDGSVHEALTHGNAAGHPVRFLVFSESAPQLPAVPRTGHQDLRLGQTVVALLGETDTKVLLGVVSGLARESAAETVHYVDTNVGAVPPGTPLFDSRGSLIGISTQISRERSVNSFTPVELINAALTAIDSST